MNWLLFILFILYFILNLTNSLYDEIENILIIYKSEISFSYTKKRIFIFRTAKSIFTLFSLFFLQLNSFLSKTISKNNSLNILLAIIIKNKKSSCLLIIFII